MNKFKDLKDRRGGDKLPCFLDNRLRFLHLSLFLLFLSLTTNPLIKDSLAQETKEAVPDERIVTGTGIIVKENIALARNEAMSQAFLKALEEYLIQRLGSQGMAKDFQRLYEEILSRTKEEVQDYQIISEFMTERYVRVLMKVRVNEAILEQKLKNMGLRKTDTIQTDVLFLVSEKKKGFSPIYWWRDPSRQTSLRQTDLSLSQVFEDRGFRVINRSFFPPEESYDESMLNVTLTVEEAVKWGELLSAHIVIAGEANLYEASRASVFLRAIKVMDGTIIAQGYREGMVDTNRGDEKSAIGVAINSWANDMIPYIIEAIKPTQKIVNRIIIMIKGLKSHRAFRDLKEFLKKNFPEIKSVLERSLKRDSVKVSVEVSGGSKGLAEKVVNHSKRPFSFEISELSEQGFTLVIIK
jgi:hypothetical protein